MIETELNGFSESGLRYPGSSHHPGAGLSHRGECAVIPALPFPQLAYSPLNITIPNIVRIHNALFLVAILMPCLPQSNFRIMNLRFTNQHVALSLIVADHIVYHVRGTQVAPLSLLLLLIAAVYPAHVLMALASCHRAQTNLLVSLVLRSKPYFTVATLLCVGVYRQDYYQTAIKSMIAQAELIHQRSKSSHLSIIQKVKGLPVPILLTTLDLSLVYLNQQSFNYFTAFPKFQNLGNLLAKEDRQLLSAYLSKKLLSEKEEHRIVTLLGDRIVEFVVKKTGENQILFVIIPAIDLSSSFHTIRKFYKQLQFIKRQILPRRKFPCSSVGNLLMELQMLNVYSNLHHLEQHQHLSKILEQQDPVEQFNLKHLIFSVADSLSIRYKAEAATFIVTFQPSFHWRLRGKIDLFRRLFFCLFYCCLSDVESSNQFKLNCWSKQLERTVLFTFDVYTTKPMLTSPKKTLDQCIDQHSTQQLCLYVYIKLIQQLGGRITQTGKQAFRIQIQHPVQPNNTCSAWVGFCSKQQTSKQGQSRVEFKQSEPYFDEKGRAEVEVDITQAFQANKALFLQGVQRVVRRVLKQQEMAGLR